jgi:hypothetical protein
LVVWKLDRLLRRQRDGINLLADWCERDVRVVVVTQQIDLSGPGGGPIVVENRKGVFSRYPKKESGSWGESDRGGTRLCEKVHNVLAEWKVYWDLIG